ALYQSRSWIGTLADPRCRSSISRRRLGTSFRSPVPTRWQRAAFPSGSISARGCDASSTLTAQTPAASCERSKLPKNAKSRTCASFQVLTHRARPPSSSRSPTTFVCSTRSHLRSEQASRMHRANICRSALLPARQRLNGQSGAVEAAVQFRRYEPGDHDRVVELHRLGPRQTGADLGPGPWDDDLRSPQSISATYLD